MTAKGKNKLLNRSLLVLGIILLLGVVSYILLDKIAEAYAHKKLDSIIAKNPNALYDYSYDKLRIRIEQGNLTLFNIKVTPKETALNDLNNGDIKMLMELRVDELSIEGLELLELYNDGTITLDKILIDDPQIKYIINSSVKEMGNSTAMHDLMSHSISTATIGQLLISNASLVWDDVLENTPKLKMDSVFLEFDSIYVDSTTLTHPLAFEFSEVRFEAREFDQELSELYRIKAQRIYLDQKENVLFIEGPELMSNRNRRNYGEITKTETDLFSIKGKRIEIDGFDSKTYFENGLISVSKVRLNGIDLQIFRDKHLPDPPYKKIPLPASAIRNISLPIKVDSIFFTNCKISSTQLDTLNDKAGTVFFHQFTGTLANFTNDSLSLAQNNVMEVNANTLFMGRGNLSTQLRFFLDSPYDQFEMHANLGRMDATVISPLLDSLLLVRITSGKIHSLSMDINGNDDHATGTLDFRYENLKLDIMSSKHEHHSNWVKKTIANTVLKSSNLSSQKNFTIGIIETDRRKDRAIFNFLWKCAKSGLLSSSTPIKGGKKTNKGKGKGKKKKG